MWMGFRILEASAITQGNRLSSLNSDSGQAKRQKGRCLSSPLGALSLKELGGAGDQGKRVLHAGFQLHASSLSGSFLALRVIPFFPS